MAPPNRSRLSTATPRPTRGPAALPEYQPLSQPLNRAAQQSLHDLPRNHKLDPLNERLRKANRLLSEAAVEINDRFQDRQANNERRKARKAAAQDSQENNGEDDEIVEQMRQATDEMTGKLELGVRRVIDAGEAVKGVEEALREIDANVAAGREVIAPTQSTLGASQLRQLRRHDRPAEDGDEMDENHVPTMDTESVIEALRTKLRERDALYNESSMTTRYASHNDYVSFRGLVHDCQHPGDSAPPLAHSSTWFQDGSGTQPSSIGAPGTQVEEDDDIAIASERISIKCPITLLEMRDPVSSKKCPHNFERQAIMEMINQSTERTGGDGRRGGQKVIQCPVCVVRLTTADLQTDPVLIRKIKRIQQAALRSQNDDDDDEDDDVGNASRENNHITSSPPAPQSIQRVSKTERIKAEALSRASRSRQVSMVPSTQL